MSTAIPSNHPRKKSLELRVLIEEGLEKGIAANAGLMAHGRGEAFDYLLGEKTVPEARKQSEAAAAMLLLARKPVISVNGNSTALCAKEIARLAKAVPAQIEINLFYRTEKRVKAIEKEFWKFGAKVLGVRPAKKIPGLHSERGKVDAHGIFAADVVLVMLEDGDRTERLKKMGKKIAAIDLNPLSRTARRADVAIVDNVVRAVPLLTKNVKRLKGKNVKELEKKIAAFNNSGLLKKIENRIRKGK